jgi:hypothetical protein
MDVTTEPAPGSNWDPAQSARVFANIIGAMGSFGDMSTAQDQLGGNTQGSLGQLASASVATPQQQAQPAAPTQFDQSGGSVSDQGFSFPGQQEFGVNSPFGGARGHPGIDLAFPDHTPVLAATAGQVVEAVNSNDPAAYNVVKIQSPDGHIATEYGHLSAVNVKVGDTVSRGEQIGMSGGAPGERGAYNASGPHLHFQVDQDGKPVDPAPFLAGAHPIFASADPNNPQATTAPPQMVSKAMTPEQQMGAQAANVLQALGGERPTHEVQTQDVTTAGSQGTAAQDVGQPGALSGQWATDILERIGAPVNANTLRAINAWIQLEGGTNHNNPLNSALDMPGAGNWNDLGGGMHVKSYVSYEQGLEATVRTLLQSNMSGIVSALRGGDFNTILSAIGHSPWIGNDPQAQARYYAQLRQVAGA